VPLNGARKARSCRAGVNGRGVTFAAVPKLLQEEVVNGASPTLLAFMEEFRSFKAKPLAKLSSGQFSLNVRCEGRSLWAVVNWPSGARAALCLAYCPSEGIMREQRSGPNVFRCILDSALGRYEVNLGFETLRPMLHWTTRLIPAKQLSIPYWPCDVYPLNDESNPLETRGVIHTVQRGPRAGCLYATLTRPAAGSFLYLQNLTALNPYFIQTETSATDRISSQWPELGFSLPPARKSLRERQQIVLSDAYVLFSPETPANDLESTRLHLDLYAELYLDFPRPPAVHQDWSRRVEETISDLSHSPACSVERHGHRYLLAYVGADDRPPESMVQLAVLLPLLEYARSRGEKIPLIAQLQANIPTFYNPAIRSIVRWLPADGCLLRGKEEHMAEHIMDSWYLYHIYLNLSRLAQFGDVTARELFLESLDYGIKVAQHFEYRWPVLYDINSLAVIRGEREEGRGGEQDVGAQYVHIMQQAWELTHSRRYVDEAIRAANTLPGLGFELGYQYNNTSFGAGGLLWLWRQTGNDLYRQLSEVCLANIVQNFWLWQSNYGCAKHYETFMGLPPLRNAPYLALYEELELLAAFHEYLNAAGTDAPDSLRVLLPEYCKYLIDRAWHHYPDALPKDAIAEKPNSGQIDRKLSIPLEDLYDGRERAGKVGQQVYGAAAPFVFATRHCHFIPNESFLMHCSYPLRNLKIKKSKRTRQATFQLSGDSRCRCHVRIVPQGYTPMPAVALYAGAGQGRKVAGKLTHFGYVEFELPGDASCRLEWNYRLSTKSKPGHPLLVPERKI
jgi:hypothetical protein